MDKKSYRELEGELQAILERIESASYDELEDLLKDHASGEALVAEMQKRLDAAKAKIKKATKKP